MQEAASCYVPKIIQECYDYGSLVYCLSGC